MSKVEKTKKVRNSNIELVRIISMIMIVMHHYTVHNGVDNSTLPLGFNRFLLEFSTLGNIGVILFILISGYFLGQSRKPLQISKLVRLVLQVVFYSASIYLIFCAFGLTEFSLEGVVKAFMPITFKEYWFATAYVVLYIFHPFINKMLNNLTRKEELTLIMTGLTLFSLIHAVTTMDFYGNEVIQFILFYIIGDYLGRYKENLFSERKWRLIGLFGSLILIALSIAVLDLIGTKIPVAGSHSIYLLSRTSPLSIIFAVSLFSYFSNRKAFCSTFVNKVAASMFGIYLLHDNNLVRSVIWSDLFHVDRYVRSDYLLPNMILVALSVFIVCAAIELVRISVSKQCAKCLKRA